MFYNVDFFVDGESDYPYGFRLYEPPGTERPADPDDRPEMQLVPDGEEGRMAAWCQANGVGPFDRDMVETKISVHLGVALRTAWDNPDLKLKIEGP